MGVTLFVGGHAGTIQGERETVTGNRMFSAAHRPQLAAFPDVSAVTGYVDSGAFTDPPERRLTFADALQRQLQWEQAATEKWAVYSAKAGPWQAAGLVSYDLLIDETWTAGTKHKRRWSLHDADRAIRETVAGAAFLASKRAELAPRRLILSAQGVDAIQYRECIQEILKVARPGDIIGFGGWCILGRFTSYLPEFWRTLHATLPLIAAAGIQDVHIFGVLYLRALGGMLWLTDRYGLRLSTDSSAPIKSATCRSWASTRKAGVRAFGHWTKNVQWWIDTLAELRDNGWYREPPDTGEIRQLSLI